MEIREYRNETSTESNVTLTVAYYVYEGIEADRSNIIDMKWHCEDGPAYQTTGIFLGTEYYFEFWSLIGKVHRYDGPARQEIFKDNKSIDWAIHGSWIDGDDYKQWLLDNGMDICNLTENDKILIDLKWKT